ncbi:MAG: hypothetical protein A2096_06655 [Spirochaetes bacterium GWF1_41_5]|nr:MAG: hypothetical protein A2096_06655 [Spirochaetes bacterium GWF1_41_5]
MTHAGAAVLEVSAKGRFQTIQKAVDAAKPGDMIKITAGIYHESITIKTENLTLEGPGSGEEPAVLDGSDQAFMKNRKWEITEGKIYRTKYSWTRKLPDDSEFTKYSGGIVSAMQVYEDGSLLRGYRNRSDKRFFDERAKADTGGKARQGGMYRSLEELNPANSGGELPKIYVKPDIRVPGRFLYNEEKGELYIWCANEDNAAGHIYNIPVLLHLVEIKAAKAILRNIVVKYSSGFAVMIDQADQCVIENCFFINNHKSIFIKDSKFVKICDNFIQQKGLYERYWYDDCKGTLLHGATISFDNLYSEGCEVCRNVITGFYETMTGENRSARYYNNILSYGLTATAGCTCDIDLSLYKEKDYTFNVSFFNNIIHHCDLQAIAVSFIHKGPVWIYRNIFYAANSLLKCGAETPEKIEGKTCFYNNTVAFSGKVLDNPYKYIAENLTVRNNIFHNQWYKYGVFHAWDKMKKNPGFTMSPLSPAPKFIKNLYWKTGDAYQGFAKLQDSTGKIIVAATIEDYRSAVKMDMDALWADPLLPIIQKPDVTINNIAIDWVSFMDYREVHRQGFGKLFEKDFNEICSLFAVPKDSPAVNAGTEIPSDWPDSVTITDGKRDIGAWEYGSTKSFLINRKTALVTP